MGNDRLFTSSCGDKVNKCDTAAPNEKCKKGIFGGRVAVSRHAEL